MTAACAPAVKLAGQVREPLLQACTLGLGVVESTTLLHQHVFVWFRVVSRVLGWPGCCCKPGRLHDPVPAACVRRVGEERCLGGQSSNVASRLRLYSTDLG